MARRLRMLPAFLDVLWWLAVAEIGVRTVPLPRLGKLMGVPLSTAEQRSTGASGAGSVAPVVAQRLRVLEALAPRWPFCDGPCLRQALVAGRVLRRHQPELRIGVAVEGSEVLAHAWIEVAGTSLGYDGKFEILSAPSSTLETVR